MRAAGASIGDLRHDIAPGAVGLFEQHRQSPSGDRSNEKPPATVARPQPPRPTAEGDGQPRPAPGAVRFPLFPPTGPPAAPDAVARNCAEPLLGKKPLPPPHKEALSPFIPDPPTPSRVCFPLCQDPMTRGGHQKKRSPDTRFRGSGAEADARGTVQVPRGQLPREPPGRARGLQVPAEAVHQREPGLGSVPHDREDAGDEPAALRPLLARLWC
mmetsp:Transcript_28608/g.68212  ORF Transcript_28608/g.68212 Transcript_28608/m.68212 type:complete len:214 (+) Transcript_28608:1606-2247(+)